MSAVITALTGGSGFSASTFFTQFTDLVPWLVLIVPVAFGIGLLRKTIKGAAKGKVRI